MSECINEYFIYDNEVKNCNEFGDELLNEGKVLYEVIRIIDGKPLFLQRHLKRLENSAKLTNLKLWLSELRLKEKIDELIKVNHISNGNVKFIFKFSNVNEFAAYFVKHHYPLEEDYKNGVSTIFYHGERTNPNAKVINNEFRLVVDQEVRKKNAFEAILVDRNGYITEGSKSNIFMIKYNKVLTAPLEGVLPGVTRDVVIEASKKIGFEVVEEKISYKDIKELDGLFISGTSPKVLPISKVDSIEFNSAGNEILLKIMDAYDNEVKKDIENIN